LITLYIATHNKTGLKYFGKTDRFHTEEDLQESYHGSGKYWKNHLEKHGDDVTMEIWYQDENPEAISRLALMFSETYNIVESKEWANLIPESGLEGGYTYGMLGKTAWNKGKTGIYSEKTLEKMRKPKTEEHKKKISESRLAKVTCRDLRNGEIKVISKEDFYSCEYYVGLRSKKENYK
jgi:hypothetical protein